MDAEDRKTLAVERALEPVVRLPGWLDYVGLVREQMVIRERLLLEGLAESYEEYLSVRGEWRGLQGAMRVVEEVFSDAEQIRAEQEEQTS